MPVQPDLLKVSPIHMIFTYYFRLLPQNLKQKRFSLLCAKEVAMTIPGIICHLQESHSEILGSSQGSRSKAQSHGPRPARVPNCRQLPKALSASSHAAIFAPGTAAGSLRAPEEAAPNPASSLFLPPGIQTPWPLLGFRREWDAASKFLPRGTGRLPQVCSGRRAAARPVRERGRRGAPAEGGEGEGAGAGGGGPGGGGAGVRGLGATFLQTTLPHAESTEISGALEGIASEREGGGRGTTQVSPRPRPRRGRGGRCRTRFLAPQDPHGGYPQSHTFNR